MRQVGGLAERQYDGAAMGGTTSMAMMVAAILWVWHELRFEHAVPYVDTLDRVRRVLAHERADGVVVVLRHRHRRGAGKEEVAVVALGGLRLGLGASVRLHVVAPGRAEVEREVGTTESREGLGTHGGRGGGGATTEVMKMEVEAARAHAIRIDHNVLSLRRLHVSTVAHALGVATGLRVGLVGSLRVGLVGSAEDGADEARDNHGE